MTELHWRGTRGNIVARGTQGLYNIQTLGNDQHILQGVGSDGLRMLALPFLGEQFSHIDDAKARAEHLDTHPVGELSGS